MGLFKPAPASHTKKYLALYLAEGFIQAALGQVDEGQVSLVSHSKVLPFLSEAEAIVKTDEALQELGKQSEDVDEVVFGFPSHWISEGGLSDLKKPLVKKMTENLKLKPIGFLDSTEAMLKGWQLEEPLFSGIVIEVWPQVLRVKVILRAQVLGTEEVGRSDEILADMQEALARFQPKLGSQYLPTTMYLISVAASRAELESYQQQILGFDWKAEHAFLQTPEVKVMDPDFLIHVITMQGGRALGGAETLPVAAASSIVTPVEELAVEDASTDFGFTPLSEEDAMTAVDNVRPATLADIASSAEPKKKLAVSLPKVNFSSWHSGEITHHPFVFGGFVAGVMILWGMGLWYLSSQVKAVVDVQVKQIAVSQDVKLTLDPKLSEPDPVGLKLPATPTTATINKQVVVNTTGVKQIGDKATGTVTINNKTTSEKTISKGTNLTDGKHAFALLEDVKIASASVSTSDSGETKTYGKADAKVEAYEIGEDSNLAAGVALTVGSFDRGSVVAEVKAALTGGASREARVVSEKDRTNARQELIDQAKKQAESELKSQVPAGEYFVLTGTVKLSEEEYDAKVGDEVGTLELTATAAIEAYRYALADLKPLAAAILADQLTPGYELTDEPPQILSAPAESGDKSTAVILTANLAAQSQPAIDLAAFTQALAGTSLKQLPSKASETNGVTGVTWQFQPPIVARFMNSLPGKPENVTVHIKP